jgi:hypothetical protein
VATATSSPEAVPDVTGTGDVQVRSSPLSSFREAC